jgi:hypothetical protein
MNQTYVPIKRILTSPPRLNWSERTTCMDFGLPGEFRGLVLIELNNEVYYMDNRTVMYISTLQTLTDF